jgi:glycosyltransferase involved in cell wall biosynthesis
LLPIVERPRRVLFVAYQFPPVGGVGAQRVTKFLKYLPTQGWAASVLTVSNPSVPLLDEALLSDIPPTTAIRRARSWEPAYGLKAMVDAEGQGSSDGRAMRRTRQFLRRTANLLLQPDPQILWVLPAVREGRRLLREMKHAAIVATAPPFSTFLVGRSLARLADLPLVLDYRDEWSLTNEMEKNRRPGTLGRFVQRRLEDRVARASSRMVATTRSSALALEEVRRRAGSPASVTHIYNGFDPDDYLEPAPEPPGPEAAYRLAYVGTSWHRTTPAPLIDAALELARRSPELAARLEVHFVGRVRTEQGALLSKLEESRIRVVQHGFVDHRRAIQLMKAASGLCILEAELPGSGRVVPAKTFEYLGARRPILAIAPRGELWDLLAEYPGARCFEPHDVAAVVDWLQGEIERQRSGGAARIGGDPDRYSRVRGAADLAALLDSVS